MNDYITRRNWAMYFKWIEGREYQELAADFGISANTVKDIVKRHIPDWAKQKHYFSANSYRNFRGWKRAKNQERDDNEKFVASMENPEK